MGTSILGAVVWQDTITSQDGHLLMIFVGVAAFALVGEVLLLIGMALGARKMKKEIDGHIEQLNAKVQPLIDRAIPFLDKSNTLVADLTPQLKEISQNASRISGNVDEISGIVRAKLVEFSPTLSAANETLKEANETVREANQKTQQQVTRVNGMVSNVLDATEQMGRAIRHSVTQPVREVSGIMGGVKVAFQTFLNGSGKAKGPVYRAPVGTYEPAYPPVKPDLEP